MDLGEVNRILKFSMWIPNMISNNQSLTLVTVRADYLKDICALLPAT